MFVVLFLAFCIYSWSRLLACYWECPDCLRTKGVFDCWVFIFLFWSFFSIKIARTQWKTHLFPFFCSMTNRQNWCRCIWLQHWNILLLQKRKFLTAFCLVLGASICNTIIYLNITISFFHRHTCCHNGIIWSPKKDKGLLFPSRTTCHLAKSHHGHWMGWLLQKSNFHHSPWYWFYGEKVTIFTCSDAEGNKRFLASQETEKPVSDCLYIFNK